MGAILGMVNYKAGRELLSSICQDYTINGPISFGEGVGWGGGGVIKPFESNTVEKLFYKIEVTQYKIRYLVLTCLIWWKIRNIYLTIICFWIKCWLVQIFNQRFFKNPQKCHSVP